MPFGDWPDKRALTKRGNKKFYHSLNFNEMEKNFEQLEWNEMLNVFGGGDDGNETGGGDEDIFEPNII